MAVSDILKQYSSPLTSTTEDGRMLVRSLAEIEAELQKLAALISFPEIRVPDLDTTGIEEAIKELKSGFPGPVPPQNLDLNPVIQTYKETQATIKELLGEVKSTNTRITGISRGGGGPSVVGLNDADGNRLVINPDGSINTTGGGGAAGGATETTLSALLSEFRNKYDVVSTAKATYTTSGNHTLVSPPPGQSLRPVWLYAQAKGALDTGTVLVTFTLGSNSYEVELTGSQPFAHGAVWEGAVDQSLIVNTSSTAAVLVNTDFRVF